MTKTEKNVLEELENITEKQILKLHKANINILRQSIYVAYLKEKGLDEKEILEKIEKGEHKKGEMKGLFDNLPIWGEAREVILVTNMPSVLYNEMINIQRENEDFNQNIINDYHKIFGIPKEEGTKIEKVHIVNLPLNTEQVHLEELFISNEEQMNATAQIIGQIIDILGSVIKGKTFQNEDGEKVKSPVGLEKGTLVIFNDYVIIADIINKIKGLEESGKLKEANFKLGNINLGKELEKYKDEILPVLYSGLIGEKGIYSAKLNSWIKATIKRVKK